MTLIITVADADKAVQVSDRRLTGPDANLYDDHVNKAVCVACADAAIAVSYTGLGFVGRPESRTDVWLANALHEIGAGGLSFPTMVTELERLASDVVRVTGGSRADNGLTIVGAGFVADGRSLYFRISNIVNGPDDEPTGGVADSFTGRVWISRPESDPERIRMLCVAGDEVAAAPVMPRLHALSESGYYRKQPGSVVAGSLVEAVRAVAGGSVGENCMAVVVTAQGGFSAEYYPAGDVSPVSYGPHFVDASAIYSGAQFRFGWTESPSADVPFDHWPELAVRVTRVSGMRFEIESRGSVHLTDVRMDLNGGPSDFRDVARGWFYSTGFVYRLPELKAGAVLTIPWQAFQSMTGESFGGLPEFLTLTARLPDGQFGRYFVDF